jgi:uncharacterized protein (TIGR02246 family)
MIRVLVGVLAAVFALLVAACSAAPAPPNPAVDRAHIEAALRQLPNDFNAGNIDGVCGLFADDVVLSYPDSPDRGHREFCDQMRRVFDNDTPSMEYAAPDIQDVIVDGDTAVVRLIWTLTVRNAEGKQLETIREHGIDVFRRQADGSWKIAISHAFPES